MKTWKDVTLEQAIKLERIKSEGLDSILEQQAILQGKTVMDIEKTSIDDLMASQEEWRCISDLPKEKRTESAIIDGRHYMLCDFSKMTLAQMVDIEEYYRDGMLDNAHKIISVIMLPAKRRWRAFGPWIASDYEPSEERENDMKLLDMETVWGNLLFFSTIVNIYMTGLADYSQEILKMSSKKKNNQPEIGQEKQ